MQRRTVIKATAATLAAAAAAAATVHAQADRPPLKILVGFPPGGSADTIALAAGRAHARRLGGQNVVVENRPGAAGRIAIDQLKNAPPMATPCW